jgi:phage head maturation protease
MRHSVGALGVFGAVSFYNELVSGLLTEDNVIAGDVALNAFTFAFAPSRFSAGLQRASCRRISARERLLAIEAL